MITWQNGTEGSTEIETGDYVTINGVNYPVKTKIQSSTPLSAENLNENQANLKDFIQKNNGNYTMANNELIDITAVDNLKNTLDNFNLSIYETPTNVTPSYGNISLNQLQIARNTDGSLAKIYGNVAFSGWTVSGSYIMETVSFKTSLRPTSAFTIKDACMTVIINNSNQQTVNWRDLTINTDGTCTTSGFAIFGDTGSAYIVFPPMLYWIKDFGDQPDPE